ncbi:MAG: nicotinate-nucleotide--dimethylbenzimidazole phosphoribosyltransferase [Chloroflexi bacterium]|nr:nicotinate-nucleotide--dimethylbenzimidazole phosphoribosyltransferase [Chloroflexota bacterium]MBI3175371.1 nicotinate-nucleotide--dimethylbenzimidazole phosphoribosyltransferase [Chloroflexota bacterium]
MQLVETIKQIQPLDETAMQLARERQNLITKPAGSLGRLEELSIQLAGMMGKPMPVIRNKTIIIMAGDHGVVAEGVSAYPQEVTRQMVLNFLAGGAAINVLARHVGAKVVVADMGVAREIPTASETLIRRKIGTGTMNLARGPAMSCEQAEESVQSGIDIALGEIFKGADILGAGDMGIGNTTPSAAIACALMSVPPDKIAGHGTGINDEGLERKISAIVWGLENNRPNTEDGLDVLAKVGGFEIGGLAGVMIGAASKHVPVMVDGFISTAAAMIAVTIAPQCKKYLIAAHRSRENGHMLMLEWLGLKPLLDLDMRLGEGSGAAIGISLAEAACKVLSEMATFAEAGVSEKDS